MSRSRIFVVLTIVAILGGVLGLVRSASANNYAFAVRSMQMQVEVRPDASARIRYEITFDNERFASPIDIVDIGLPHDGYDRGALRAWIDGHELKGIRTSTYIDVGVEVPLHGRAIAPGQSGTFTFETVVPDMVYSDTTNAEQASLRITPTWFDGSLVRGTTDLKIGVWLPKGVDASRVLHHGIHGDADYRLAEHDGRILVGWHHPNARLTQAHMVGVSFPREVMTRVVEITRLELLLRWWEGSPEVRTGAFIVLLFGMGFAFFRFSGGTGASVFVFVTVGLAVLYWLQPRVQFYTIPVWLVLGVWMERKVRRGRGSYLPPIISVEGGGIKRGLTAPAAAVLLQLPLGRVLTLVIFGMLKKGLIEAVENRPLRIRVPEDLATRNRGARRKAAAARGVVIHKYEHAFIDAVGAHAGLSPDLIDFADAMKELVENVAGRVTGYDLPETRKYYAQLVERAWTAASAIGELEHRTQAVDRDLEWLIMDERYTDRFDGWERSGYRYRPIWIRSAPSSLDAGARNPTSGGSSVPAPTLGDVGASFAGWSENVANGFMSSLQPAAVRGSSGVINLGGADKVTVDVLSALFSGDGSGGGGGGGGGCACACAGCACACACAGGGR
jgi:hypothetical protein